MGLLKSDDWIGDWLGDWIGHDEASEEADSDNPLLSAKPKWIWMPGENALHSAPIGTRYFRRQFEIPMERKIVKGELFMAADNSFAAAVNGHHAGDGSNYRTASHMDVTASLRNGKNLIAAWAKNMVQQDATTIWELWNGNTADPAMNSGNHVMLVGDLVIWLYECLAGIQADPAMPGFKHIRMKPHIVGDLKWVKATHNSPYGRIASAWKRTESTFHWDVTIPANCHAIVWVPTKDGPDDGSTVNESGQPIVNVSGVKLLRGEPGYLVLEVASGVYRFESEL